MRQFILEKQKIKNGLIKLEGKDYKYLRQVLRVKVGDMLNVRKPDGELAGSTVASIDDKAKIITLQLCGDTATADLTVTRGVQAHEISEVMKGPSYYLFQFIPKPQKFEQIVRQATECGILKIIPVIGEYSEKSSLMSLQNSKQERLERIVKEARQQSGSAINTQILQPMTIEEAMDFWNSLESKKVGFVLSERNDFSETVRGALKAESAGDDLKSVAIACGSEGGISPEEISVLREKGLFHAVHFAVNILRCETAALYGTAAIQTAINEETLGGE